MNALGLGDSLFTTPTRNETYSAPAAASAESAESQNDQQVDRFEPSEESVEDVPATLVQDEDEQPWRSPAEKHSQAMADVDAHLQKLDELQTSGHASRYRNDFSRAMTQRLHDRIRLMANPPETTVDRVM
jgi:hypothetical protein